MTQSDPTTTARTKRLLLGIRVSLTVVIAGLVVSGVTAFPLREEMLLAQTALTQSGVGQYLPDLAVWVARVAEGLDASYEMYPFIAYGTDWLAYAHLLIAVAFIGPFVDPIRNVWVTWWGLTACAGIIPLAVIAGGIRGLPAGWQLIDISFGVIAAVPLTIALVMTRRLSGGGYGHNEEPTATLNDTTDTARS